MAECEGYFADDWGLGQFGLSIFSYKEELF